MQKTNDSKELTARIRKALKAECPTISVKMGTGTAYCWIDIKGSDKYGKFTFDELKTLTGFGFPVGINDYGISIDPKDREYYADCAEGIVYSKQV